MADYNLGTARGVIEIEYKGDGADRAREDLGGVGKSAKEAGPTLDDAGRKAGIAGLVIAGGFAVAAKSAADFEARMSAVGAVSGASEADLQRLSDKALQLGKDTAFSAGESAQAIEELVKAGLSVEDVLNGAADATVNLAAAGEVDMVTAATIASNAMNQFGLSAEDMVGVVDNIAGAANASAIDVTDFGMSLSQVGAVANLAGVDFKDTATAIALMGNAGIKGSDAGTSLKTMFQRLNPQTKVAREEMKRLGIITEDGANRFYDAEGNMKSLADVSQILKSSLKGMSAEQKQAALTTLFGADAIRGAAVLADEGARGFNKMSESMNKVSAADVAAQRLDNFKGSLEQMMGSLETLGITVGTMLLPHLRNVVDALTAAVNWFSNLNPAVQQGIVAFIGIVGASLLALAAFVKIVNFLKAVKAAFIAVRAVAIPAWLAALGPIALVIVAIAAVIAIIVLLWKKSETFRDIVTGVWNAIKSAAQAVANWFTGSLVPALQSAWDGIVAGLNAVKSFFVAIWNGIKSAVIAVFSAIAAAVRLYINIWKTIITTALAVIGAVWQAFWNVFGGVIKAAFGLIVAVVRLGWTIIKGLFILYLRAVLTVVKTVWNAIKAAIQAAWNAIRPIVMAGVNFVRSVVSSAFNAIRAVTSAVWNGIRAVIASVWGAIRGVVSSAVGAVKGAISAAWNTVKSLTSSAWNAVKEAVGNAIDGLMNLVSGIQGRVTGALSGAASWLYNAGREIIQGLLNGIESMIGAVTDKINSVTDKIGSFLPGSPVREGPLRVLNRGYAGKKIVEMLAEGIGSMQRPLERTVETVMTVPALTADLDTYASARNTTIGTSEGASRSLAAVPGGTGTSGKARLVEGRLSIDKSGRAFIRGMAEDVVEGNDRFAASHGRMG